MGQTKIRFFFTAGSIAQCLGFVVLSYSYDFKTLALSSFVLGAANGSRIFLFIIILINDFGLGNLAHTFSHANLFMGILTLVKPFLVGKLCFVLVKSDVASLNHLVQKEEGHAAFSFSSMQGCSGIAMRNISVCS